MEVAIVTVHQNLPQRLALCEGKKREQEGGMEGSSGMTSEDRLYNKETPPPPQLTAKTLAELCTAALTL